MITARGAGSHKMQNRGVRIVKAVNCLILILLWQSALNHMIGFSYTDEIITLFLGLQLVYAVIRKRKYYIPEERYAFGCVLLFYFIGAVSTFTYNLQNDVLYGLASGLFSVKAFTCYFGARAYFSKKNIESKHLNILLMMVEYPLCIVAILLLLNPVFHIFPETGIKLGIMTTSFIFAHPTELACFGVCSLILSVFIRSRFGYRRKYYRNLIPAIIVVVSAGRYKALGAIVLFVILKLLLPFMKGRFKLKYIALAIPAVIAVGYRDLVFYFSGANVTARGALYANAVKIARDFFPLGAGFGTYGTDFSQRRYSSLYYTYDMSHIWGLVPGDASFAADAMWPGVLGETGVIGSLLVIALFGVLFLLIKRQVSTKALSMEMNFLLLYVLIESVADTIFMSSRGCLLFMVFAFMVTLAKNKEGINCKLV